jgi:BlaI family penicillinase repressor
VYEVRISEAEWEVMEVLWRRSPATAAEVISALQETSWAPTTIRTMLTRLVEKRAVTMKKQDGSLTFRPRVDREECVRRESESFLERVFGGATNPLLVHFVRRAELSPDEVRELQRILRTKGKK